MAKLSRPRHGSLQFYPRKRAEKLIPSANWKTIKGKGILGFIAYKVGMASAVVKDNTSDSMTKNKRITIPVTILETPSMKIFSIRFYKHSKPVKDIIVSNEPILKRVIKLPKQPASLDKIPEHDDIRIIAYSIPSQTGIKKTPDIIELAVSSDNKLEYVKSLINKEITLNEFIHDSKLFDIHGLTKGKGLQGPVKRFGLTLKAHKSEKGVRRPGSLGPWHPARVTFRAPLAGQLGFFSRTHFNHLLIIHDSIKSQDINKNSGFKHYGKISSSFIILKGSVQGPPKRPILLTPSFRPTKFLLKKKYDFQELI